MLGIHFSAFTLTPFIIAAENLSTLLFLCIPYAFLNLFGITIDIKRLHDLNRPYWYAVLANVMIAVASTMPKLTAFSSIAYIGFILALCMIKGTTGSNKYGEDPVPEDIPTTDNNSTIPINATTTNSTLTNEYLETLKELSLLKDKGIITEEEFQRKKEELLAKI